MGIHKSFFYYESTKDDSEVEAAIRQKAEVTNEGFWKIFRLIRKDGHPWNHKKVHRVYEAIHFNKRKPLRKRLPAQSCRRSKSGALHTGIPPDSLHGGNHLGEG
jgi:hypothetical protein